MRILISTYFFLPQAGGVGTYIEALKQELERNGHHVDVLAQSPDLSKLYIVNTGQVIPKSLIYPTLQQSIVNYYKTFFPALDPWILQKELGRYRFELTASLFDLTDYDIIHTQDLISTRIFRRIKPKHVPLVCTIHGQFTKELMNLGIIKGPASERWHYQMTEELNGLLSADKVIVPTKWMRQEIEHNFNIEGNIAVIPYCASNISAFLKNLGNEPNPPVLKPKNKFVIGCISRLVSYKGHPILFDALQKLKARRADFVCWVVGDGPEQDNYKQYAEKNGLKHFIHFLGSRKDVPALLNKMDIVVLPTLQDNMPFSIIEAQLAGKAIIASKTGGIPEMITHRETGLIFQQKNSNQLANQLFRLLKNRNLRQRLETNAQTIGIKQWAPQLLYKRLMRIYDELLDQNQHKPDMAINTDSFEKFGIIKDQHIKQTLKDLFLFETQHAFDGEICSKLMNHLPETYHLPDLQMLKKIIDIDTNNYSKN